MAAFGWSAGDIAKAIELTVSVCKAFKEAGGAATKYKQAADFLGGFKTTLQHLHAHTQNCFKDPYTEDIQDQLKKINGPWKAFESFLAKYEKSLGENSKRRGLEKAPRTVQWALKDLSGEVEKLEDAIARPLQVVNSMLSLQILYVITTARPCKH
jgi:hypothetical protein